MNTHLISCLFLLVATVGCHGNPPTGNEEAVANEQVQTPVTVTAISTEPLTEYVELNATSLFQQDNIVKSSVNGYVKSANAKIGQFVRTGQNLFVLRTKESEALGNTINKLDTSFRFSGVVNIASPQNGYITSMDHQAGDYVQDGEQLAVISDSKSFAFILNVPYEMNKYVALNKNVEVILPDSTRLSGVIASFMPAIDSASQTEQVRVKVNSSIRIPENLIAKVRILKSQVSGVASLPRQALLSNESQSSFWVMKLVDSVTAIKVSVTKGIETNGRVQIIKPEFSTNDKFLLTGNFGLPDTAKVKIMNASQ